MHISKHTVLEIVIAQNVTVIAASVTVISLMLFVLFSKKMDHVGAAGRSLAKGILATTTGLLIHRLWWTTERTFSLMGWHEYTSFFYHHSYLLWGAAVLFVYGYSHHIAAILPGGREMQVWFLLAAIGLFGLLVIVL